MTNFDHNELGSTPLFACQYDKRFSYCLYVPSHFKVGATEGWSLAVIVHGSGRDAPKYRDCFQAFAEDHNCIVVAPLFPCRVCDPDDLSSYKFLTWDSLRFDLVLLAMIDEVACKYGVQGDQFLMFGFSGGGQFVHRFFYVHPERLKGLSIGAPGMVTLPSERHKWWVGVSDLAERFGKSLNWDAMRCVPVQMVIGAEDLEVWEITISPDSRYWMDCVNDSGVNRHDRLNSLQKAFEEGGVAVRHDVVEGVGHNGYAIISLVTDFFEAVLASERGSKKQ